MKHHKKKDFLLLATKLIKKILDAKEMLKNNINLIQRKKYQKQ